jgi:formylglycine-generating enzyme required for sulfatase activity
MSKNHGTVKALPIALMILSLVVGATLVLGQGGTGRETPKTPPKKTTPKKGTSSTTPPRKSAPSAKPDTSTEKLHVTGVLRTVTLPVPPAAKDADVSSGARIRITLDETGQVTATQPVHGHPAVLDTATSDAKQQHFSPATLNGRPVKSIGFIDYVFTKPNTSAPTASPSTTRLEGTITLDIDPTTGLIAVESCPVIRTRTFPLGTEPRKYCGPEYHRTTFTNSQGIEFNLIRGTTFMMGSRDSGPMADEKPQHQVAVPTFFMGKYEVTQAQWRKVMGDIPEAMKGLDNKFKESDKQPAVMVSWNDAQEFVRKLNALNDGYTYRLPTEAEWEFACRAGTTTEFAFGDSLSSARANFDGNAPYGGAAKGVVRQKTIAVGSFRPNAFGLYDMHGNVWEWCEDWYHETYAGAPTDGSAWLSGGEQKSRVLRGGSWNDDAAYLRSAVRGNGPPGDRYNGRGFRVVAVARTQ